LEKKLYLLANFDKETQCVLSGYYDVLRQHGFVGSQTKEIPYHFTLGSRAVACESQTLNDLERICAQTPPIEINLGYVGLFGLNVIFIGPNMNFELLQLQQKFFPDCGSGFHYWAAHATILIDRPEVILQALPILAEKFKPFKVCIESISLYEFFPTRFIGEYPLNGGCYGV